MIVSQSVMPVRSTDEVDDVLVKQFLTRSQLNVTQMQLLASLYIYRNSQ